MKGGSFFQAESVDLAYPPSRTRNSQDDKVLPASQPSIDIIEVNVGAAEERQPEQDEAPVTINSLAHVPKTE